MLLKPAPLLSSIPTTRGVTTTDVLKLVGLVFVLVDHYGLFFDPDETWWRLFGRIAAPIFFFLIGYARTRTVPWTWLAFGAVLTATDFVTSGGFDDVTLNILLNFALLRWLVLPLVERHVLPYPWRLAVLLAVSIPLIPISDDVLEYGTEGWLWTFFGLAHRTAEGSPKAGWTQAGTAAVASAAYILREIHDYGFDPAQSVLLAVLILALLAVLSRFRRATLDWTPPPAIAALLRFCGRYSLEIYAVSLFVMQVLAYGIDVEADGSDGGAGDEAA